MSSPIFRNIGAYIASKLGVAPQSASAGTINGAAIDRLGFGSAVLVAECGAATGAPTTRTVNSKLQQSADGSTGWTDVTNAATPTLSADNGIAEADIDLSGCHRYVRQAIVAAFTGGTSPAIPVSGTVVLGGAQELPV